MKRLSKLEWEQHIYEKCGEEKLAQIFSDWNKINNKTKFSIKNIWYREGLENFRLSSMGIYIFEQSDISCHKFVIPPEQAISKTILGLSRLPCPFGIRIAGSKPYSLTLFDDEYATYLYLLDCDFLTFSGTFINPENDE